MRIYFESSKLQQECSKVLEMRKAFGVLQSKKIQQRLWELSEAETLSEVSHLPPPRCHELMNRAGMFSVDLKHPFRLLFIPAHEPIPRRSDGGIDRELVTEIIVVAIEDTHDKKNKRKGVR